MRCQASARARRPSRPRCSRPPRPPPSSYPLLSLLGYVHTRVRPETALVVPRGRESHGRESSATGGGSLHVGGRLARGRGHGPGCRPPSSYFERASDWRAALRGAFWSRVSSPVTSFALILIALTALVAPA